MTGPGYPSAPPPDGGVRRRRPWLIALVAAWILVVAGLAVWSVGHERASVPEQRTIGQAVPKLQKAAGVVFAAAGGPGRAVVLGELAVSRDCRVTPVRAGVTAVREVTVQVRAGEARAVLETIASGLPAGYRPDVSASRGGTSISLHADAGDFIGIDSDTRSTALDLTLRLSTGCRPLGSDEVNRADPAAGAAPAELTAVLGALGAPAAAHAAVRTVACPGGGVAGSFVVDGVATPGDVAQRLRRIGSGASDVRNDDSVRAYRTGNDSVVVERDEGSLRVSVSTSC